MAEEKDTDSAPDDGATESDVVTPSPRHGIEPVTPDEPESLDDQHADTSADEVSADDGSTDDTEVPEELRDAESATSPDTADEPLGEDADQDRADDSDDASSDESDRPAADTDDSDDGDEETDDDRELVGVGAAATSGRSGARSGGQLAKPAGRTKKDKPTPKQRAETDKPKRTTPLEFVRGAISELKKVVYPTGSQLANYFVVVLVFVLLVIAIVTALDYGFGWLMLKVFS